MCTKAGPQLTSHSPSNWLMTSPISRQYFDPCPFLPTFDRTKPCCRRTYRRRAGEGEPPPAANSLSLRVPTQNTDCWRSERLFVVLHTVRPDTIATHCHVPDVRVACRHTADHVVRVGEPSNNWHKLISRLAHACALQEVRDVWTCVATCKYLPVVCPVLVDLLAREVRLCIADCMCLDDIRNGNTLIHTDLQQQSSGRSTSHASMGCQQQQRRRWGRGHSSNVI